MNMKTRVVNKKPCVYFITDDEYVKIGVTEDLSNRLRILQTANARKLTVLDTIYTDDPYKLEEELHRKYSSKKVRQEWFDILEELADEAVHLNDFPNKSTYNHTTKYYSPEDLERILQFNSKTISKIIELPDFPMIRIGEYIRVPSNEFFEYMDTHRTIQFK